MEETDRGLGQRRWLGWIAEPHDIAIHEAAHVISKFKLGMPLPTGATIIPNGRIRGTVSAATIKPWCEKFHYAGTWGIPHRYFVRDLGCFLSGYAANFLHRRKPDEEARHRVLAFLRACPPGRGTWGEKDDVLVVNYCLGSLLPDDEARREVILGVWDFTRHFVGEWWTDIEYVAEILLERKTLNREELDACVYRALDPLTGGEDLRWLGENVYTRAPGENWIKEGSWELPA